MNVRLAKMLSALSFILVIIMFTLIVLFNTPSLTAPQDTYAYLNSATANQTILTSAQAKIASDDYVKNYYFPWNNTTTDIKSTREQLIDQIKHFILHPGWDENQHLHSLLWISQLINNMSLGNFPNHIQNAIVVHDTNARIFPSNIPTFTNIHKPGSDYPFDDFQDSYLTAGTPIKVIQESHDKAWVFVLTSNSNFGDWVAAQDIAYVDNNFISAWQNNAGYITVKADSANFRMGQIYPIDHVAADVLTLKIPKKDLSNQAVIQTITIDKNMTYTFPLTTTPHNIAMIANQFLDNPYGWGGMYGYRDCSSTTQDIFAYFGVWLARNSFHQYSDSRQVISLENLSRAAKTQLIQKNATPFFSLIYTPGHIALYIGEKNNTLYVLQDMWGLRTARFLQDDGRLVIGKTVITPITFGDEVWNVRKTLLDRSTNLIILNGNYQ